MSPGARIAIFSASAVLATAAPAQGATTIGETFAPAANCVSGTSSFQTGSPPPPAPQFAAPTAGVITSWSFQAGSPAPDIMRLKVGRHVTGDSYLTVARSDLQVPLPNQLNTFATTLAVQ